MAPQIDWTHLSSLEVDKLLKEALEHSRGDDAVYTIAGWAARNGQAHELALELKTQTGDRW